MYKGVCVSLCVYVFLLVCECICVSACVYTVHVFVCEECEMFETNKINTVKGCLSLNLIIVTKIIFKNFFL